MVVGSERTIQTQVLRKFLILLRAWEDKKFVYTRYGQFIQLRKIGKLIGLNSERATWDYYTALRIFLEFLGITPIFPEKLEKFKKLIQDIEDAGHEEYIAKLKAFTE